MIASAHVPQHVCEGQRTASKWLLAQVIRHVWLVLTVTLNHKGRGSLRKMLPGLLGLWALSYLMREDCDWRQLLGLGSGLSQSGQGFNPLSL